MQRLLFLVGFVVLICAAIGVSKFVTLLVQSDTLCLRPVNCYANVFSFWGRGLPVVVFCASCCLLCEHTRAVPFLPLPFYVLENSCRLCSIAFGGCALFQTVQWTTDLHVRACVRVCVRARALPSAFSFVTCTTSTITAKIDVFICLFVFIRGPGLAMTNVERSFSPARPYCDCCV